MSCRINVVGLPLIIAIALVATYALSAFCADFDGRARDAIKQVKVELKTGCNAPVIENIDAAMRAMEPIFQHPESVHLKLRQDWAFDAPPPVQTNVGPNKILYVMQEIAIAYEGVGDWSKARDIMARSIDYANTYCKLNPPNSDRQAIDNKINDDHYVRMYTEYARSLERTGDIQKSRQYSKLALLKLCSLEKASKYDRADQHSFGYIYDALGIIATERHDPMEDIDSLFKRAIELRSDGGAATSDVQADSMTHLADALEERKNYSDAEAYYRKSADIMKTPGQFSNPDKPVYAIAKLARCYWLEGKRDKAISTLQDAIQKRKASPGLSETFGQSALTLAYFLKASGKPEEAQKALHIADDRAHYIEGFAQQYGNGSKGQWALHFINEAHNLRSDINAVKANSEVPLEKFQSFKEDFPLFNTPFTPD